MSRTNEEKLLSSIDGTLKDILKELKKQNRVEILTEKGKAAIQAESILKTIKNAGSIRS